jgi:hypothetical protein
VWALSPLPHHLREPVTTGSLPKECATTGPLAERPYISPPIRPDTECRRYCLGVNYLRADQLTVLRPHLGAAENANVRRCRLF